MDYTGGAYMSMPYTNSEAVKFSMTDPFPYPTRTVYTRDPHPPYATNYTNYARKMRPASAPVRRFQSGMPWRKSGCFSPRERQINNTQRFMSSDTDLTRYTPYASRTRESFSGSNLGSPVLDYGKTVGLPNYNALNDPHLNDYWQRKFALMPTPPAGKKKPKKAVKKSEDKSKAAKEVLYKVYVTTGDVKNGGTQAKVFLRMKGSKGKLNKKRLITKKAGSTKKRVAFKFSKGSCHIFKIKSADLGDIKSIHIEHDGLTKQDSWFLQDIKVVNTANKKEWEFPCFQWLSLFETDCQLCRELFPRKYSKTDYEIITSTGDVLGAGTDANVFVTIYGRSGVTPKLQLKNNKKDPFERGSADTFVIHTTSVGPMERIKIEHDNTGRGPGWFLERVVVTDLKHPKWKYFFPCGKWLDKKEGDGAISRVLLGSVDPLTVRKDNRYKVTVVTGDRRGAGTDANVYITMFGDEIDSGEKKLNNSRNNFERDQKDEFFIECPCLGPLKRVRIGHDNKGLSAGWFLDKVIIDDLDQEAVYEFPCDRWLARDEDDGLISRELIVGVGANDPVPGIPYQIHVFTSDIRYAGTSSRVYIVLYGGKDGEENSGKIWLDNGQFERGRTDVFNIEVISLLSPLSRIDIGHDGEGAGAGWHLNKVIVVCPSVGIEQHFLCNKWLATDEGDGLIERTLFEHMSLRKERKKLDTWFVWIRTSDTRGAGTDAKVYMVLYGKKGKSDEVWLQNETDNFEQGQTDKFKVQFEDVGLPYKLRIGHDNSGMYAGWKLESVEMENMATNKRYTFDCDRWLAKDEDDGQIVRELPAKGPGIKEPQPVVHYNVAVHTGKKFGSGTDANVFVNIYGEQGDTGDRPLEKSKTNRNKFEKGNVDEFVIEAVTLKNLSKIRIGHDGKNSGDGWFLDKVVVSQAGSSKYDTVFECNRWLASDEDDGQIVREITAGGSQMLSTTSYHVSVKTGDERGAGTDANVFLKIFGAKGDTGNLQLRQSENSKNKFERNRTDLFKIEATDIGKIERIRLGHDGSNPGAGWFVDEVRIDVPSRGEHYVFAMHRWLAKDEGDGEIEIELSPTDYQKRKAMIPYEITIWTSDVRGAGADSNVFIQMYGEKGKKTEDYKLRNRTDNFEQGQQDKFKVEAADIGPLEKIRIGHDGAGMFSGWHLEKVLIQRFPSKASKRLQKIKKSKSKRKLRKDESEVDSEEETEKSPKPLKRKRSFLRKYSKDSTGSRGSKEHLPTDEDEEEKKDAEGETEDYWFFCNKWFARSEDDGAIIRELVPTDEHGNSLDGREEVEYTVKVHTGDIWGAGTDANVFFNMTGTYGDSGERQLRDSDNVNKFERNVVDTFKIKAVELGTLTKVKIRHDNAGGGAAWFLDSIEVDDPKENKSYYFPCQRWLSTKEDDGQIARDLIPADKKLKALTRKDSMAVRKQIALETKAAMTTYHVHVYTGDKFGAGTDANVYVVLFGEENDTGQMFLKTSLTNKNKFERNQRDEFILECVDIGDLNKIKIGHDNAGGGGAWFLDKVEIDAPSLGHKWVFPCGRWLAKDEEDGLIERELYPQELATEDYIPCVPYELTVFTTDTRSAGTSADVYIAMYGKEVATQQKPLCANKQQRKDAFKRGGEDKFVLELEDVGETIEKIRIGHGNEGLGPGWHLDRVEIRRLTEKGSATYIFPCKRWLARDEDDGCIERELVAAKLTEEIVRKDGTTKKKEKDLEDSLTMKKYAVDVYTGDVKGAGTDANVHITIYGDKGDTGSRKLHTSETNKDKFERNQVDKFQIEAADLGKIFKIRIGHDNAWVSPAWYLDRVEIRDTMDDETYVFHCERWLAKNKDDGKIERNLFVKGYDGDMSSTSTLRSSTKIGSVASLDSLQSNDPFSKSPRVARRMSNLEEVPEGPTIPYTIKITTGDEKDHGTQSNVWIKIMGTKKMHTGRLHLELAQKDTFAPGSTETFSLEAVDVNEVKKIEIGHDGVTPESGWYLKEVELDMPTKGKHYFFQCSQWLSKDKGDGKTSREFTLQDGESSVTSYKPLVPYEVTFHTGDVPDAGTDAKITMTLFGANGSTPEVTLEKGGERFERARVDKINMELDDIGKLLKLRLGHDGKGTRNDWFVDKIEFRNMITYDLTVFKCNDWLSKSKGDGKLSRDLPAVIGGKAQVKRTSYKIYVKTSNVSGAGTDANVFVVIFGQNGDSGDLALAKSETFKDPFENDQEDIFTFNDMLSLGDLAKLRVWHDNKGLGAAWHLAHIEVEDLTTKKKYMFPCNRWLSKKEDDKQIIRELICTTAPTVKDKGTYEIMVTTSDKKDAGIVHNGWIILEGDKKTSKVFIMENSAKNKILRRCQTDTFTFKTSNVGTLECVYLGAVERDDKQLNDAQGRDAMWHCHEVIITDTATGSKYVFPCKSWITIESKVIRKNGKCLELKSKEESKISTIKSLAPVKYKITVVTGDIKGAGTDANVSITLYGENGDSGKRPLKQSMRDLFERNQTDVFEIEVLDLGELTKLHVEHDNSALTIFGNPGWYLERIEVVNLSNNKTTIFPCQKWLDKKKGDGLIERDLLPQK